jgi:putative Mg2+ transporter-C (MgtC) family protein
MISFPTILLRLGVAALLGAIIGLEREQRVRGAGMRTLALVSLGSALFTIVSAYGFLDLLAIPHVTLDPTRIASYIVAGIGFLGAGTIFLSRTSERVRGLTTAASIWVIAAIGIACGAGMLLEATATTVIMLIVLVLLRFVERAIVPRRIAGTYHLHLNVTSITGQLIASIYEICPRNSVTIQKLSLQSEPEGEVIELICRAPGEGAIAKAIGELRALPGVNAIQANPQGTLMELKGAKHKAS